MTTRTRVKKRVFVGIVSVLMLLCVVTAFTACRDKKTYYNNETDALVFSTQELDKVFNPFFSTSATDGNVVGLTQIGMIGNDKNGRPVYGDDEAVVVKDMQTLTEGEGEEQKSTYYFVLKNNVRFSNGTYLTMKDVLFNLYVYLDPVYTGSATMYSTDIVGLKEYRTQAKSTQEQESFKKQFMLAAESRTSTLISACETIEKKHKNDGTLSTDKDLRRYLESYEVSADMKAKLLADYDKTLELFREELESDYSNSVDSYQDMIFVDKAGKEYKGLFTTDVEVFLYNEGYITWNKKEGKLESMLTSAGDEKDLKTWTKEKAIDTVYNGKIPSAITEVLTYWNTAVTLNEYLVNLEMELYFQEHGSEIKNISGIEFANMEESVKVNGVTYDVPAYTDASRNQVSSGNEVLKITINKVDPKAIWNFAFSVAPMYYYSDAERIAAFDYKEHFGVEYASQTFMTSVVKSPAKIGVPVGAGPYVASKSSGGTENVTSGDFYDKGIVYYEANPYYVMGAPKIKKVQYKVVGTTQIINALLNKEIDFAEPNAKPEIIKQLDGEKQNGIANKSVKTAGYGYIGINAGKVPDMEIRQVIMHCINTQECVDYYQTTASAINRSMSMASWAYPKGCTPYYPYIAGKIPADLSVVNPAYRDFVESTGKTAGETLSKEEQREFLLGLIEEAGYSENASGIYQKGNNVLKYTFTIAGETTDHPGYWAMKHASEILNKIGFQINVTTDSNALKKLASGDLTVWAAAWGSTIDPDMYQVYHKDSTATSVLNWGYKQIKANVGGKYDRENALIDELSELIEKGRETEDQDLRATIYSKALDIVMQLAIELPTYQRDDLFAYNVDKIDASTLTPDSELSPYKGLTSDIYNISLNQEK